MSGKTPPLATFMIAWVSALPLELAAAHAMLDEEFEDEPEEFRPASTDSNIYVFGRIHKHNIVLTALPKGEYGETSATETVTRLSASLPHLRAGLMVGIGAGVTRYDDKRRQIRLGDVVISTNEGTSGGVVQYASYKAKVEDWQSVRRLNGHLNHAPRVLQTALSLLDSKIETREIRLQEDLAHAFQRMPGMTQTYAFPGLENDHVRVRQGEVHSTSKASVDHAPTVHFGTIASASQLIKDTLERDEILIWLESQGVRASCFEMEAGGLMNAFPCLVIRGICDYADELKNDDWQRYSALTAAGVARELLRFVKNREMQQETHIATVLEQHNTQLEAVREAVQETNTSRKASLLDKVKHWLCPTQQMDDYDTHLKELTPGTAMWLLNQDAIRQWSTQSQKGQMLCTGGPGLGKTKIMTNLIRHLKQELAADALVLYVYCDHQIQGANALGHYMAVLLRRALQFTDKLHTKARKLYADRSGPTCTASAEQLLAALQEVVLDHPGCFIVVDALDECNIEVTRQLVQLLSSLDGVRSIFSSRPLPAITACFAEQDRLSIEVPSNDVHRIVQQRLQSLENRLVFRADVRETIINAILKAANGSCLLAKLNCDSLQKYTNARDVLDALPLLHNNRDDAYADTMARIQSSELAELGLMVLRWVVNSKRPLTVHELQHAIATRIGDEDFRDEGLSTSDTLISATQGLVISDSTADAQESGQSQVRVFHTTAQEYLESLPSICGPEASSLICAACITYISFDTFTSGPIGTDDGLARRIDKFAFMNYASTYMGLHLSKCDAAIADYDDEQRGQIMAALCRLRRQRGVLDSAHEVICNGFEFVTGMTIWHLTASRNLVALQDALLEIESYDKSSDSRGRTPLLHAVINNSREMAQHLLSTGLDDCFTKTVKGHTPLMTAVLQQNEEMVTLLLEYAAEINARDIRGRSAIFYALERSNTAIVSRLLDQPELDLSFQPASGDTLLHMAIQADDEPLCHRLLDRYEATSVPAALVAGMISACGVDGLNSVCYAAKKGWLQIVLRFIGIDGVDPDVPDRLEYTPFYWTIAKGQKEVAAALLDTKRIRCDPRLPIGKLLLAKAAEQPDPAFMEMALSVASLFVNDWIGQRPALHIALDFGNTETALCLLGHPKIDINGLDEQGRTHLIRACQAGDVEIVRALLAFKHVDLNRKSNIGHSAIYSAVLRRCSAVVDVLLEHGNKTGLKMDLTREQTLQGAIDQTPTTTSTLEEHYSALSVPENESLTILDSLLHAKYPVSEQIVYYAAEHRRAMALDTMYRELLKDNATSSIVFSQRCLAESLQMAAKHWSGDEVRRKKAQVACEVILSYVQHLFEAEKAQKCIDAAIKRLEELTPEHVRQYRNLQTFHNDETTPWIGSDTSWELGRILLSNYTARPPGERVDTTDQDGRRPDACEIHRDDSKAPSEAGEDPNGEELLLEPTEPGEETKDDNAVSDESEWDPGSDSELSV